MTRATPQKKPASKTSRDVHLVRDLKPLIDFKKTAQGAKVVTSETVRVDLSNLAEVVKSFLDLVLEPMLVREVKHVNVGKPRWNPVEAVGALV